MSEYVWIVRGTTGKGADRRTWTVDAWRTEQQAASRVRELHELLGDMATDDNHWKWSERREREASIRADPRGDQQCNIDYTGTRYFAEVCELRDESTMHWASRRSANFWARIILTIVAVLLNIAIVAAVWHYQPGRLVLEWLQ